MPYSFLDDVATADIAFQATGKNLDELFTSAAEATINVMVENFEELEAKKKMTIAAEDETLEMLLFKFLQEIIFFKDADELLLRPLEVHVQQKGSNFTVLAEMGGEAKDPQRHQLNVDVKAVTFHRFSLIHSKAGYQATVVLDI